MCSVCFLKIVNISESDERDNKVVNLFLKIKIPRFVMVLLFVNLFVTTIFNFRDIGLY